MAIKLPFRDIDTEDLARFRSLSCSCKYKVGDKVLHKGPSDVNYTEVEILEAYPAKKPHAKNEYLVRSTTDPDVEFYPREDTLSRPVKNYLEDLYDAYFYGTGPAKSSPFPVCECGAKFTDFPDNHYDWCPAHKGGFTW
jgi:hypothetical protein